MKKSSCNIVGNTKYLGAPSCLEGINEVATLESDGKYLKKNGEVIGRILESTRIKKVQDGNLITIIIKYQTISENQYMNGIVRDISFNLKDNKQLGNKLTNTLNQ